MAAGGRALIAGIAAAAALACAPRAETPAARNLLLVSLDTLRADHLGAYGYGRDTSPGLDALAARGVRFETVVAESGWTLPSHVSLLSGLPPSAHRVTRPDRGPSSRIPLLAEVLADAGFRTAAVTGGSFLTRRFGFQRGFEVFEDASLPFPRALARARAAIDAFPAGERWFVFVHTYDIHCPYDPPPAYARRFDTRPPADHLATAGRCGNPHFNALALRPGQFRFLSDRYDAGIRYADDLLARFLAELEESGALAEALVAVVSDHGEEFGEHGRVGHRETLYVESLRVPFLLAGPGLEPAVVAEPASLADVMPTLLELLDIAAPPVLGRSLAPLLRGERAAEMQRRLFSENDWGRSLRSVVAGDHHLIAAPFGGEMRLFDWRADPREATDLSAREAELRGELWQETSRYFHGAARARADAKPVPAPPPDASEHERLRALGYVE